jgi:hypothetical protein
MGNAWVEDAGGSITLDREPGANVSRLDSWVAVDRYLRPDSDIVALMVLEHQVTLHNLLAEAGLRVRRWLYYQQALQKELGEPVTEEPTGTALRVVESETRRVLEGLLFVGEAPLPEGGVSGHADFTTDGRGRSLKELNLRSRLFEYRCSYLIHSEAFTTLPGPLKSAVYHALKRGLLSDEAAPPFAHLPADERAVIAEILTVTQPEWLQAAK